MTPLSLFQRLSAFFPEKTRGRLKIFLHSFPAKVARGELHLWVVKLWLFSKVHPTLVQWDLSRPQHQLKNLLFIFAFNVPLAEFTRMFWVIILHEYKSLSNKPRCRCNHMMLQYAMIAGMIQFAHHQEQIDNFAVSKRPLKNLLHALRLVWYRNCSSFTNTSPHIYRPIEPKRFRILIHQFKGLYFTALLCAFWHGFASPTVITW